MVATHSLQPHLSLGLFLFYHTGTYHDGTFSKRLEYLVSG